MSTYNIINVLIAILIIQSCATYQIPAVALNDVVKLSNDGTKIFLIGDAGYMVDDVIPPVLNAALENFKSATKNDVLLFLGDNIYPNGMPDVNQSSARKALEAQINIANQFPGKVIFIPGNHDWYSGLEGLKAQQKIIEKALGKNSFLPEDGCPIGSYDVNDDITVIIVDSEWFITDWDKHPGINDDCDVKSELKFWEELNSVLNKNQNKQIVFAIHHPLQSYGNHGGFYGFGQNGPPFLNMIVSLLRKTSGISPADLQHPLYRTLSERITTLLQPYKENVIVVSGHDHNLQFLLHHNIPQIISGSGSKANPVKQFKKDADTYGYPDLGFAVIHFESQQQNVRYFNSKNENIHAHKIRDLKPVQKVLYYDKNISTEDSVSASIYEGAGRKSLIYRTLFGNHYRDEYYKKIRFPSVRLDTLYGGLSPLKLGGGQQSMSLRMVDTLGREYVLRRMKKNAAQFIQANAFPQNYIQPDINGTAIESFLNDYYTTSYPFGSLLIDGLADIAGVFHSNTRIMYIDHQPAIQNYAHKLSPGLYQLEERAAKSYKMLSSFGAPDDIISSEEMLALLEKDEKYTLDIAQFIKTRLFDMWIGDWDRHEDQVRWGLFKQDNKMVVFRPIPRDRDQAFSKFDGWITRLLVMMTPAMRKLPVFSDDITNLRDFNANGMRMDLILASEATPELWKTLAQELTDKLKDPEIERVFDRLPAELKNKNVTKIRKLLTERRRHLVKWAEEYYRILNRKAIVTATGKDDIFELNQLVDGSIHVLVKRNKKDSLRTHLFEKMFSPKVTEELWLFGGGDKDKFEVNIPKSNKIKIKLIGGMSHDIYDIKGGENVKVYDYLSQTNTFEGVQMATKLTDDYAVNNLDIFSLQQDFNLLFPVLGFNPDAGLILGFTGSTTKYGLINNPFAQQHILSASLHTATNGISLKYSSEFAQVIGRYNLLVQAHYKSPIFAQNYFGSGNDTENLVTNKGIDYHRVRLGSYGGSLSLVQKGRTGSYTSFSIPYEVFQPGDNEDRIADDLFTTYLSGSIKFIGAEAAFGYQNYNLPALPTLGFDFGIHLGWKMNVDDVNRNFMYLKPSLKLILPLDRKEHIIFSTQWNGQVIFNNKYEFYQAANIGGTDGVRGLRNERFSGQRSYFQNTDLRWHINSFKTGLLPMKWGLASAFDYG
ncbi:MAG: metallophosphoesterase, partial [Saprospiraceae bacterium]